MAVGECCDRKAIGAVLTSYLGMLGRDVQRLGKYAAQEAVKLGLDFVGEIESDAPILRFPLDVNKRFYPKWDEIEAALAAGVGRPTALFSAPQSWCMGIRGTKGDMRVTLIDVKQHRFEGVAQCLADFKEPQDDPK
jgi:hypothetical protein